MKPAPFQMHRARSVAEAIDLLTGLGRDGAEARVIAGGQSLVPMMNFRLARPDHLIDLGPVDELTTIELRRVDGQAELVLGAMVTQADALASPLVAAHAPMLVAAMDHIGHGHIRNRGTVGGSVAHADPAAELPVALVALEATIDIAGPGGARRSVPADRFFQGWFSTDLGAAELLVSVRLAAWPAGTLNGRSLEWGFEELSRRQGDYAMALAATVVQRTDEVVTGARVVVGGVAPTPVRSMAAESVLLGTGPDERASAAAAAAEAAAGALDPPADVHADAHYRRELVAVLVARALQGRSAVPSPPPGSGGLDRVKAAVAHERPPAGTDRTAADAPDEGPETPVVVNGTAHSVAGIDDRRLLADWLRDDLGLTGTHLGCEHGVCGACTVMIDDRPIRSCLTFAGQAAGHTVTTIEALGTPDGLHPVQAAFRAHHGLQCGFCTPGMVLATVDLLAGTPHPSEAEIRRGLSGNLCRCTGYTKIVEAVVAAAETSSSPGGG